MAEMKGFYFSLDALLAASILMGVMLMLINYQERPNRDRPEVDLDQLHTSLLQDVSDWNKSMNSSRTVIGQIYYSYYSGNLSEAEKICSGYFRTDKKFALYFGNSTETNKACGNYSVSGPQNTVSEHVIVPDIPVNESFIGPQRAVLVMPD